tara:strand:- start:356 stop:1306 length:951 start_codon:yes stop_codon:yes gene_type:complete
MERKKILITGAAGMIGHYLVKKCLDKGYDVLATDIRFNEITENTFTQYDRNHFEFIQSDLREFKNCKRVVKGVDIVFNVAGVKGSTARASQLPNDYFTPMLQFNTNMAEAARLEGVEWYVYTSSVGVYSPADYFFEDEVWKTFPSPNDRFAGWAKRIGELQGDCFNVHYGLNNFSIVRPANVYGKGDDFSENGMVIPQLVKRIHTESPFICWGDGSPIRDFIHADDVADGILLCYEKKITEPINLGSGKGVSIKELVDTLVEIYDGDVDVKWDKSKPNGDAIRLMDMTRANKHGFYPKTDLKTGLKEVVEYYESIS